METYVHTKNCTWMFIAALVIIAPEWKQPKCYQLINGKTKCGISILCKSARAARLGGLSNRNVFSHSSGSWKSLISFAFAWPLTLCLSRGCFLLVSSQGPSPIHVHPRPSHFLIRTPSPIGLGPYHYDLI